MVVSIDCVVTVQTNNTSWEIDHTRKRLEVVSVAVFFYIIIIGYTRIVFYIITRTVRSILVVLSKSQAIFDISLDLYTSKTITSTYVSLSLPPLSLSLSSPKFSHT